MTPNIYKADPGQGIILPLAIFFQYSLPMDNVACRASSPSSLTWVRKFWCSQTGLRQTYMVGRSDGAQEHHQYPTAVRIKEGTLPLRWEVGGSENMMVCTSVACSVTTADRRGADRGIGFTTNSPSKKRDRDAGPFMATESRSSCYGAG